MSQSAPVRAITAVATGGISEGYGVKTAIDAATPPPLPAPAMTPGMTVDQAALDKAANDAAAKTSKAKGRAATMLTGSQGSLTSSSQTFSAGRQLLGS